MAAESLRELFIEELRDMYDAEKRLTKALPRLAKAAESSTLQHAFSDHAEETKGQVARLEQLPPTVRWRTSPSCWARPRRRIFSGRR